MRSSPSRRRESAPELHGDGKQTSSLFRRKNSIATTNSARSIRKLFRSPQWKTLNGQSAEESALEHPPERVEEGTDTGIDQKTSVLASYDAAELKGPNIPWNQSVDMEVEAGHGMCDATTVLQHSFLFCNNAGYGEEEGSEDNGTTRLSEDPTVQESIECVFSSQLEEGLPIDTLWEESADPMELMSPAVLLQSRTSSRLATVTSSQYRKPKKTFRTGSLIHLGTYDSALGTISDVPPKVKTNTAPRNSSTPLNMPVCSCSTGNKTPLLQVSEWPQYPLMFRVGAGTVITGVRFSAQKEYLWKVGDTHNWVDALNLHWGKSGKCGRADFGCPKCMTLPINNGNEPHGESLVADFESDLWIGTVLLRLRFTEGTTVNKYDDSKGYFAGMNRRYQAVITGSPKRAIPISHCVTGLQLERKAKKLPAKWIIKGALKLLQFFAPQLECKLDHDTPYSLTPLGSTPQMVGVDCLNSGDGIERKHEEPTEAQHTILGQASPALTSLARAKFRKKALDRGFLHEASHPQLSPQHEYTMEFLQHLFSFQTFEMELGSFVGNFQLKDLLNGQPLQLMALEKSTNTKLWSFDIWHECLVEDSMKYDKMYATGKT